MTTAIPLEKKKSVAAASYDHLIENLPFFRFLRYENKFEEVGSISNTNAY